MPALDRRVHARLVPRAVAALMIPRARDARAQRSAARILPSREPLFQKSIARYKAVARAPAARMRAHAAPEVATAGNRSTAQKPAMEVPAKRARPCDVGLCPRGVRGAAFACPVESHPLLFRPGLQRFLRTTPTKRPLRVTRKSRRAREAGLLQWNLWIRARPRWTILRLFRFGARRQRAFRVRGARPVRWASAAVESQGRGASALLRLSCASRRGEIAAPQSCTSSLLRLCVRLFLRSRQAPTPPLHPACAGKVR